MSESPAHGIPQKRLAALNQAYNVWRQRFGWGPSVLPTEPQHDGTEHIELIDDMWHLIATERGLELSRQQLASDEALLEELFIDATFGVGVTYEFRHRITELDCRRMIFAHQLQLLAAVNMAWHESAARRIAQTLAEHPYVDRGI